MNILKSIFVQMKYQMSEQIKSFPFGDLVKIRQSMNMIVSQISLRHTRQVMAKKLKTCVIIYYNLIYMHKK